MAFDLQKNSQGLIDLFRLKTMGRMPDQFGDSVQPIVEVADFYGLDLLTMSNLGSGAGVFPRSVTDTIEGSPQRFKAISARITMAAAGTYLQIIVGIRTRGAPQPIVWVGEKTVVNPVSGVDYVCLTNIPRDLLLAPGSQYIANAFSDAAGNHELTIQAVYELLGPQL